MSNLIVPFLAGQDLTAAGLNNAIDYCQSQKYQTADTIRNNTTTYLDSTDLTVAVAANTAYLFEGVIFYDTNSTADIKIRISLPTGSSALIVPYSASTAATSGTSNVPNEQAQTAVSNVVEMPAGGVASGTIMTMNPKGWILIGSASGNVTIGHTQNVATAVNSLLKQGSSMKLSRVL